MLINLPFFYSFLLHLSRGNHGLWVERKSASVIKLSIQYAEQRTAAAGSLNCRDAVRILHCQKTCRKSCIHLSAPEYVWVPVLRHGKSICQACRTRSLFAFLRFSVVANWVWSCDRINTVFLQPVSRRRSFMEIETKGAQKASPMSWMIVMASQLYWLTYLLTVLFWRGIRCRFAWNKSNNNIKRKSTRYQQRKRLNLSLDASKTLQRIWLSARRAGFEPGTTLGCAWSMAVELELGQVVCRVMDPDTHSGDPNV